MAGRWISGITVGDAIRDAKRVNASGERVMINCLGEGFRDKASVDKDRSIYIDLIKAMHREGIVGCIAVKPTQLGLSISYRMFVKNYADIIAAAHASGIFVWTDMEEPEYVDSTIKAYLDIIKKYDNAGICIQARLRRSFDDVKLISKKGGTIRLVKGAYGTKRGVTYMSGRGTDSDYIRCMDYMFRHCRSLMVATHDKRLIDAALDMQRRHRRKLMFAMLKGIRPKLAARLAGTGQEVYIYLPFGESWLKYSLRRIKELEHVTLLLRSMVQG